MNKYRTPATVIAVAGATIATGMRAYKTAKEARTLQDESEMSHIERLEHERVKAREHGEQRPSL